MSELSNDDFHDEDPEHLRHIEDLNAATRQIDPNHWVGDSISAYRARTQEIEMGITTEYDPISYDNDSTYSDPELLELQQQLEQKYDAAIIAVADLHKTIRDIRERQDYLRSVDINAQIAAQKILKESDVTIKDLFPRQYGDDTK